ncbi:CinA family nicotinamide mononucleotide deamidase-related protein [Flavobacterium gawalongense]|uniref:CinA-like protein n=1 Tax=Flavobacterium gawalongense TaxID=2594432 RepID=A0A553BUZ6_9FLAO|nr:CinA family nicotinamide mononucleotide deamidase-related protein [Flavobacterium gawalongense]TRX02836.1 CinA family nicotinamide mononucleotide deamidase-related protein [Flavobacterium gawalongense]TRX08144.1 CinA family nicotinamide mononucleotide deamidase-related protein [Flavobacterium gawalongense]TRX11423.1 CinA family nicotinamide mononucleotide deamidase-related protein [Flavobacterium gawalongense]TRX12066.1 CinA family nicotinamide mononucleotide deamidase-related protein [Flavo
MKATIVTIGDEILIGQIVDTNSGFIAKSLDKIGVEINEMISISDDKKHILDTFLTLQNTVDLVIITGGLGPTKDDVTKKTFCDYFEDELIVDQEVLAHVTQLIEGFYKRTITQINKDQALVPSKCTVLHNQVGTAPGMWMKKENTVFISLPGVPYEMKYLVEHEIIPKVVREYKRPYIIHKTILTYGQGESLVAERIEDWENNLPEFIKLAYLPSPGKVRLRLSARGTDKEKLEAAIEKNVSSLDAIIHDIIVGFEDDETLEVVVGKILTKQNKTISTAESCTGGKIAEVLTSVSGSSKYFKGSVVSYATEVKINVLGIPESLIKEHSVVSREVVSAMALSVKRIMKTDYAIAATGNAGPLKGDSNAEVGTVFIALATPSEVIVEEFNFGQPREKVIDRAVIKSLELLQKEILKNV